MLFDHTNVNKFVMWGGNFLFFTLLLAAMVDPSNSILHLKNPAFILLLGYNLVFLKPDFTFLPCIIMPYVALVCSFLTSQIMGVPLDYEFTIATFKGFSMLILLLWVRYYNVMRLAKCSAFIFSLLAVILFIAAASDEMIQAAVWTFQTEHENCYNLSTRYFLGIKLLGISFNSTISTTLPLFASAYAFLAVKKHRFINLLEVCLITTLFIVSGSRSTMILPFVILSLAFYLRYKDSKYVKLMMYPIVAFIAMALLVLIYKLAAEKGETSNVIKYAHLYSYGKLFHYNPEYFILGEGAGSYFFSMGFRAMVPQTEWSYLEILRMCGVFSVGIFYLLLYPVKRFKLFLKSKESTGIIFSYVVFLFVAGTNPMLINSSGMCVMMMIFCYMSRFFKSNDAMRIGPIKN